MGGLARSRMEKRVCTADAPPPSSHPARFLPPHCWASSMWQDEDMVHEVMTHLDANSLASASCVCRAWRKAADDQSLWERICTRDWPSGSSSSSRPLQFKAVVQALGGFRRLYVLCLRPLLINSYPPPPDLFSNSPFLHSRAPAAGGRQWSKDEVHLSLSLFSIDCFERLGRGSSFINPSSLELLTRVPSSSSSSSASSHLARERLPACNYGHMEPLEPS